MTVGAQTQDPLLWGDAVKIESFCSCQELCNREVQGTLVTVMGSTQEHQEHLRKASHMAARGIQFPKRAMMLLWLLLCDYAPEEGRPGYAER